MGKFRGYEIEWRNGEFVFCDTGKPTISTWKDRPCGYCGKHNTPEGHDGCLGTIPGVINACCGHGENHTAYLQFPDFGCIRGEKALKKAKALKALSKEQ